MSRQAQVGAFAILALLLLFGVFFIITDFATRHTGYRVGIHFNSAAGLHSGALVYFSGVTVGTVDSIVLLPDNTVDVVLAVNTRRRYPARLQVSDSSAAHRRSEPADRSAAAAAAAGRHDRPDAGARRRRRFSSANCCRSISNRKARTPRRIADLLEQGQGEVKRLDIMLADLQKREPQLAQHACKARWTTPIDLTSTANRSVQQLSRRPRKSPTQLADQSEQGEQQRRRT